MLRPCLQVVAIAVAGFLATAVGLTALGQALKLVNISPALDGLNERLPWAFVLHMGFGGAALLLSPLTIVVNGHRRLHRMLGRVTACIVIVAGMMALPLALQSDAPLTARLGFLTQGLVWLTLLGIGLRAIRRGQRERHRCAMILLTCVAFGAVLLRILLALQSKFFPFDDVRSAYALIAWASWTLPLCVGVLYLYSQRTRAAAPT